MIEEPFHAARLATSPVCQLRQDRYGGVGRVGRAPAFRRPGRADRGVVDRTGPPQLCVLVHDRRPRFLSLGQRMRGDLGASNSRRPSRFRAQAWWACLPTSKQSSTRPVRALEVRRRVPTSARRRWPLGMRCCEHGRQPQSWAVPSSVYPKRGHSLSTRLSRWMVTPARGLRRSPQGW